MKKRRKEGKRGKERENEGKRKGQKEGRRGGREEGGRRGGRGREKNCAWQITRRLAKPGRAKQNEAPCRHNGQVSEFTKMNHPTEPQEDDEWSLRLWRGTVMVSK